MNPNLERLANETKNPDVSIEQAPNLDTKDNNIVILVKDGIYALCGKEQIPLFEKKAHQIKAICYHGNQLYYSNNEGVFGLDGEQVTGLSWDYLCGTETQMFASSGKEIAFGKNLRNIIERDSEVLGIGSYKDVLWFSQTDDEDPPLYSVYGSHIQGEEYGQFELIDISDKRVRAMCYHDDLYFAQGEKIVLASSDRVIAELPWLIRSLHSAGGDLWALSGVDVINVNENRSKGSINNVMTMTSVPESYLKRMGALK